MKGFRHRINAWHFYQLPGSFWMATLSAVCFFFTLQMTTPIKPLFVTDKIGQNETFLGTTTLMLTLIAIIIRIPAGSWLDSYGRRQFMIAGAAFHMAHLLVLALWATVPGYVLSQILFAFSIATYITAVKTYVADIVPAERRGEAFGIHSAAFPLALTFGPLVGDGLKNEYGFAAAFGIAGLLATFSLLLAFLLPPAENRQPSGASIFKNMGQILKLKGGQAAVVTAITGSGIFTAMMIYFPLHADYLKLTEIAPDFLKHIAIGLSFSIFAVVSLVGMPLTGRLADRRGRTMAVIPGVVLVVPTLLWLSQMRGVWAIYLGVVGMAMIFSFLRNMMDVLMQDACPDELRGTGMAILYSMWDISIGIQSLILGILIDQLDFEVMYISLAGYMLLMGTLAIYLTMQANDS